MLVGREQRLHRDEAAWEENERILLLLRRLRFDGHHHHRRRRRSCLSSSFVLCGDSPPPPVRLAKLLGVRPGATEGRKDLFHVEDTGATTWNFLQRR